MVSKIGKPGYTHAQVNIGMLYLHGQGVAQNYPLAKMWFEKAAKDNDALAMNNLGYIYNYAVGVPQNKRQAVFWYEKAEKAGSCEARNELSILYFREKVDLNIMR
jgi:TPR repeat protein